jgi:hypothetical protein
MFIRVKAISIKAIAIKSKLYRTIVPELWEEILAFGWQIYDKDSLDTPVRIFKESGKSASQWGFMIDADSKGVENFPQNALDLYGLDWESWPLLDKKEKQKEKSINLTNWSIQAATGFPKGPAPKMLTGIDEASGNVLGYEEKYLVAADGKVVEYYGPALSSSMEPCPNERLIITLTNINPEYEKHIRRWCIETWDPENPIRVESKK